MHEVGDHVAACAGRALHHGIEVEEVTTIPAGVGVGAKPALEQVGRSVTVEPITAAAADHPLDAGQRIPSGALDGAVSVGAAAPAKVDRDPGGADVAHEVNAGSALQAVIGAPTQPLPYRVLVAG